MASLRFQIDPEFGALGYRAVAARLDRVMGLWERNPRPVFMDPDEPESPERVEHWLEVIRSGGVMPTPAILCVDSNPVSPAFVHVERGRHRLAALERAGIADIVVAAHPNNHELAHRLLFDPQSAAVLVD
jgi:hypothetical protein